MKATIDKFGRILIPKKVRQQLGITTETNLNIDEDGKRIIIEPISEEEPVIDKDGILVFTGKLATEPDRLIAKDREARTHKLLKESKN